MDLSKYGFTAIPRRAAGDRDTSASTSALISASTSGSSTNNEEIVASECVSNIENPPKRVRGYTQAVTGRKYDPKYIAYGFYFVEKNAQQCPQCVVCKTVLSNSSMAPTKLLRHLETTHSLLKEKPVEYFQRLCDEMKGEKIFMGEYVHSELAAIESSFAIAYEIAKTKKPYAIAERLIQPCLAKAVEIMLGSAALAKINSIPLSGTTIMRRFEEMAKDVEDQLRTRLQNTRSFSLQFDESTDIGNEAILVGFVRYTHESQIVEDIFCYISLPDQTTGEKIFEAIGEQMQIYDLNWKQVVGLCTDGAAAMTAKYKGLATRVSAVANEEFVSSHCVLHREALASKQMSPELNETLKDAVKIINNIKASALHSRIFALICDEMDSGHRKLLFHADVRWLSRGNTLSRLHELRTELITYFERFIEEQKKRQKRRNRRKRRN